MRPRRQPIKLECMLLLGAVTLVSFSLWLSNKVVSDFVKGTSQIGESSVNGAGIAITVSQKVPLSDTTGNVFLPGSLTGLTRTEAVNKCYVDPAKYIRHKMGNICTYSPKYDLFYYLLPKSGSSTGRHVMKHSFDAKEHGDRACRTFLKTRKGFGSRESGKTLLTVSLRNPLTRFYASYDEMFVRRLGRPDRIPEKYNAFMKDFEGWDYDQYKLLFDTTEGVDKITRTFEKFVRDYDAVHPFDVHVMLQTPSLSQDNGKMHKFDIAFDTHDMKNALYRIAERVGAEQPKVIRGRSYPRRINVSDISTETLRKICRLSAIDFCCLNYELPKVCLQDDLIPVGERVRCRWVSKPDVSDELMIEAITV